jgi:small subunit ribosomal protein S16
MAVKIRLTRLGKKKQPTYRVVVMDSRKTRDGQYIEQLGFYDPRQEPSLIQIDNERALHWLTTGAQPTERAKKLLEISGAWTQFKIAKGEIHTVGGDAPKAKSPKAKAPNAKAPNAKTPEAVVPEAAVPEAAVPEDVEATAATTVPEDQIDVPEVVAEEAEAVEAVAPSPIEPIPAEAPDKTEAP